MKRLLAISFAALICASAFAEDATIDATQSLQSVGELLEENAALLDAAGVDVEQAKKIIVDLDKTFQGTYVYDLGAMRENAKVLIPLLQQNELTSDYALWLQSRLDYFEVAEQLRKQAARTTNTVRPPAVHLPDPSPKTQRDAWITVTKERPMPPLAQQHVPALKRIFISEKVPPQLVWVAEVESSFNSKARSPAGAAGLFQLMPATARNLDLSTGVFGFGDERLNTEKSGRAAARYLRQLHKRFGNWPLALAAYNAGEGRVAELLKKHKAHTFEAIANRLPAETQMYVPKVEAIMRKREGVAFADLKTPKA
ncbi:MAG: Lytic transglycosylase catalytic [Verrucomicrobiales bacterium]|nr:Lytic transglycosylase catalytic [Verrucomicrobiales bacterium]